MSAAVVHDRGGLGRRAVGHGALRQDDRPVRAVAEEDPPAPADCAVTSGTTVDLLGAIGADPTMVVWSNCLDFSLENAFNFGELSSWALLSANHDLWGPKTSQS